LNGKGACKTDHWDAGGKASVGSLQGQDKPLGESPMMSGGVITPCKGVKGEFSDKVTNYIIGKSLASRPD
jgi:hypothetical protein